MIKRLAGALGALVLTAVALAPATAAGADPVHTSTATIKSTPDDGCPTPWARDSFERRTMITPAGEGTFKVVIADEGTFTTNPGAKSPADPATLVAAKVTGSIKGSGEFTVTGELRNATTLAGLNGKTFNNSAFPCKTDVPAERTTGKWPLQFFKDGAQASGIDPWTWTYTTPCESMTESSIKGENVGNITGATCPAQTTFTPATCDKAKSAIKVVNPNSHATLRVRFNQGPTHHVKAGQSHTHWFGGGSVQVRVNGVNIGVPYPFVAATGCATPTPTATATADPEPTPTPTAVPSETPAPSDSPDPVPPISTSPAAGGGLPLTGAPVLLVAGAGLLAVAVGGGLLVLLRRREPQIEV